MRLRPWVAVAVALAAVGWGANQFAPMLLVYHQTLGLDTAMLDAMFGVYALGLIPGLLVTGPISDARGRRVPVVAAALASLVGSLIIVGGAKETLWLFVGRFVVGVSSGMMFSAGTSWLRELSLPPHGTASPATAARRAAVAMTIGFGAGPLVTGVLAQWAPAIDRLPYVPHLVLIVVAVMALLGVPETVPADRRRPVRFAVPEVRLPRFRQVVLPLAPWVFAAPAIAFALLPEILHVGETHNGIALTGLAPPVMATAGILIQPLGHRLDARSRRNRAAIVGLLVLTAGLVLSAVTSHAAAIWLLVPCAAVLGAAYGLCLVAGLIEVQALARPGGLAGLTAAYYALTYLGFAAPFLFTLANALASYAVLLGIAAVVALAATALVAVRSVDAPVAAAETLEPVTDS